MQLKRTLVLGALGGALAVWIAAAATTSGRRAAPVALPKPQAIDMSGEELASEVARLQNRLRPTTAPVQSRDLFHYAGRATVGRAKAVVEVPALEVRPPAPAPSPLKLVGIAEDHADAGPVRTAILSGFGELFLVTVGESVTPRYRVEAISADAVELIDVDAQSTFRLQLK